jgi:hypothetical protein
MTFSPPAEVARVPLGYPTALIYMDESTVKASGGRFFVVGAVKVRKPGQLMRAIVTRLKVEKLCPERVI